MIGSFGNTDTLRFWAHGVLPRPWGFNPDSAEYDALVELLAIVDSAVLPTDLERLPQRYGLPPVRWETDGHAIPFSRYGRYVSFRFDKGVAQQVRVAGSTGGIGASPDILPVDEEGMIPHKAPPPGVILKHWFLNPRGVKQDAFARVIKLSKQRVNYYINGYARPLYRNREPVRRMNGTTIKRKQRPADMSVDTILRIEEHTKTTARFWSNLQSLYHLSRCCSIPACVG